MGLKRISYIGFLCLSAISIQTTTVSGKYILNDSQNNNCEVHTLILNNDSTYEYVSQCQNSYGKWFLYKNSVILNFEPQRTYGFYSDFYYVSGQTEVIVRLWGKNTFAEFIQKKKRSELTPTAPIKPLICEEIVCWYKGKEYSAFTNNNGEAVFTKIQEIDSISLKSMLIYNKSKGVKFGVLTKEKNFPQNKINNATFYFSCNSNYHRFMEIKKCSVQITPKGLISKNKVFVNGEMPSGVWVKK